MSADFFDAIALLEKEKSIPREYMKEKIAQALITAYKRDNISSIENTFVEFNDEKREMHMFVRREVVEEVEFPPVQITLDEARVISPGANIGDFVNVEVPTKNFGRIAAQTAKQVIIQGIREAERDKLFIEYSAKEHDIISAQVLRRDMRTGGIIMEVNLKGEKSELVLPIGEQIKGEVFREGAHVRVFVVEVRNSGRGPQVLISRTHPGLIKRLFEIEVPEITDGIVQIHAIAREAGSRTKISVSSADPAIDPRGACIGTKSRRINSVVGEFSGEKVDIVLFSEDQRAYVAAALSPASVIDVTIAEDEKACRVIVPDDQLSLAIGKEGQNARLAAKLTGIKIDIKPASSLLTAE